MRSGSTALTDLNTMSSADSRPQGCESLSLALMGDPHMRELDQARVEVATSHPELVGGTAAVGSGAISCWYRGRRTPLG